MIFVMNRYVLALVLWAGLLGDLVAQTTPTEVLFGGTDPMLLWEPSPSAGVVGYRLRHGAWGGSVTNTVEIAAPATSNRVAGLAFAQTNFLYVTARDARGTESGPSTRLYYYPYTTSRVPVTTNAIPQKPVVSLVSPAAPLTNVSTVKVQATAGAALPATTITKVEYFDGETKLGETPGSGGIDWTNVTAGAHALWAKATDELATFGFSQTNRIQVYFYPQGDLAAPQTLLAQPLPGQMCPVGQPVALRASASAGDGTISRVEFYVGGTLLASIAGSAPYSTNWTPTSAGTFECYARAYTAAGYAGNSLVASLNVFVNHSPTVAMTQPADGASVGYGYPVALAVSAADADTGDAVAKIEYYLDGALLATSTNAPFGGVWSSPVSGSHTLYAKASDYYGGSAASTPRTVTIQTSRVVLNLAFDNDGRDTSPQALATAIHGTLPFAVGVQDRAAQFGAGQYLSVDQVAPLDLGPQDFTAEAWIRPSTFPTTGRACLWSHANTDSGGLWLVFAGATVSLQWGNLTPAVALLTPNRWHHVAAVRHGDLLSLYADGALLSAVTPTLNLPTSTAPVQVGAYAGGSYFPGLIDNLRITKGQALYDGGTYPWSAPALATLSQPTGGQVWTTDTVRIQASASAVAGVARIDIQTNNVLLTTSATNNLVYDWPQPRIGSYTLQAIAVDTLGNEAGSDLVVVTAAPPPLPPSVALASPLGGQGFTNVTALPLTAAATANVPATSIVKLEFFDAATKLGETAGAATLSWNNPTAGTHALWVLATDNLGGTRASATNTVGVYSYNPDDLLAPTVTLTSPSAGASLPTGKAIQLAATASAGSGSIARVEFYVDGALAATVPGTLASAAAWTPTNAGAHTFQARAFTAALRQGNSSVVSATAFVNQAPTVTIATPSHGTTLGYGMPLVFEATASDTDPGDAVTQVDLFVDGALAAGLSAAPYRTTLTNLAAGARALWARAQDRYGASRFSATNTVTVQTSETVLYLAFDGTYQDSGSYRLTTASHGSMPFGIGVRRQAARFSAGNYLTVDSVSPLALGNQDFTVEAWVNPAALPSSGRACLWSHATPEAGGLWLAFSAGGVALQWAGGLTAALPAWALNSWHHVAAVRRGNTLSLYADGALRQTGPLAGTLPTSAGAALVGGYGGASALTGQIDELKITRGQALYTDSTYSFNPPPVVVLSSPTTGSVLTTDTVTLAASATDADGVDGLEILTNGVVMSSVSASTVSNRWVRPAAGTYVIEARAVDGRGASAGSTAATLTVSKPLVPPTVVWSFPAAGGAWTNISSLTLAATVTANDPATGISRVEFFDGGAKLGETAGATSLVWSPVAVGSHALWARATDNLGGANVSGTNSIAVYAYASGDLTPPSVSLVRPTAGELCPVGQAVTLLATADAGSGSIAKVEFYANGGLVGTATGTSPYASQWTPAAAGTYTVYARAYTAALYASNTSPVSITAFVNRPPSVALSTPADLASLGYGNPVALQAAANDPDPGDRVTRVEFFVDGTVVGVATNAPFAATWLGPASGSHTLYAKAYDAFGQSSFSSPNTVTIQSRRVILDMGLDGNYLDSSPNLLQGTPSGMVPFALGVVDRAALFHAGSYVALGATSGLDLGADDFTAEIWLNAASLPSSGRVCLWGRDDADAGGLWLAVSGGATRLQWANQPGAAMNLTLNEWHHVAATRQGSALRLYADGTLLQTLAYAGALPGGVTPSTVGYRVGENAFEGFLDRLVLTRGQALYTTSTYAWNRPPLALLASPASGGALTTSTVRFSASATDGDGIARLDVLTNGVVMRSVAGENLQYDWVKPPTGTYTVQAYALDARGASAGSPLAVLTVTTPSNPPPVIALTSPTSGSMYTTGTVHFAISASDADGVARIDLLTNGVVMRSTAGATTLVYDWTNPPAGSYRVSAVAVDSQGASAASTNVDLVVIQFILGTPSVALRSPAQGDAFTNVSQLLLTAEATANPPGTSISRIEFYDAATKLGETAGTAPYTWTSVTPGAHSLWTRATDNLGGTNRSLTNLVTVYAYPAGDLTSPSLVLASPASGQMLPLGQAIALSASASAGDGTISHVEFLTNGAVFATRSGASPYTAPWTPVQPGTYTLAARAFTAAGYRGDSSPVVVTLFSNRPPTVTLTAPTNGASVGYGLPVGLWASASDPDLGDEIARVEFYGDGALLGSVTSSPYRLDWANPGSGSHSWYARAFDRFGLSGLSTTQALQVQASTVVLRLRFEGDLSDSSPLALPTAASGTIEFGQGASGLAACFLTGGYAAVNDAAALALGSEDFTVETWFNATALPKSGRVSLCSHDVQDAGGLWLGASAGSLSLQWANGLSMPVSLTTNEWHHVAAVRQGNLLSLYLDGALRQSGAFTATLPGSANPFQVGAYRGGSLFSGFLDELRITRGQALYTGASYPFNPPPVVTLARPASGSGYTTNTITFSANASDGDGVARIEILTNNVLMRSLTGGSLSFDWVTPPIGRYVCQARAVDTRGATAGSALAILSIGLAPVPPSVALSAPLHGSSITNATRLLLQAAATALAPATGIVKLKFFDGAIPLGEIGAGTSLFWTNPAAGAHSLWVQATDDLGNSGRSATNQVQCVFLPAGDVTAPNVTLTSPTSGGAFPVGLPLPLAAVATPGATNGTIARVEFYANETLVATVVGAGPYTNSWIVSNAGTYTFFARAYTRADYSAASSPVVATAFVNRPPWVTLTAPTNGATLGAGTSVSLQATAFDLDAGDSLAKVEFYIDGSLLGTLAASPYQFTWTNPASGSHTVFAKGYDSFGASSVSATHTVSVQTPQLVLHLAFDGNLSDTSSNRLPTASYAPVAFGSGVQGSAALFQSNNAVVVANGKALALSDQDFTVEAWVMAEAIPQAGRACLWSPDLPAAGGLWLGYSPTGTTLRWAEAFSAPLDFTPRQWHHLAAVRQGGSLSLYADGARLGTTPYVGSLPSSLAPAMVGSVGGSDAFTGFIDELRILRGQALYTGSSYDFNPPPTVSLAYAATGEINTTNTVRLTASAVDANGVARLELLTNNVPILSVGGSTLAYEWVRPAAGVYAIQARATDLKGASASSAVTLLTIGSAPAVPIVSLSNPADGQGLTNATQVLLTATAEAVPPATHLTRIEFYDDALLLGETAGSLTLSWTNPTPGKHSLWVKATDNLGVGMGSVTNRVSFYSFQPGDLTPPQVALVTPTPDAQYLLGQTVPLAATAGVTNGSILQVDFFANNQPVASVPGPGVFATNWIPPSEGTYIVFARAHTAADYLGDSSPVAIHVIANRTPVVALTSPLAGASVGYGAPLRLEAQASDPDLGDAISRVAFYLDGEQVGQSDTAPYVVSWSNAPAGSHTVWAKAFDSVGASSVSESVRVEVQTPEVALNLRFDGNYLDSSPNRLPTASQGNVPLVAGVKKQAAAFDGQGYVTIGNASTLALGAQDFTVETWVFATALPTNGTSCLWTRDELKAGGLWLDFVQGSVYLRWGDTRPVAITLGLEQWHHLAVARQGSLLSAYEDGVLRGKMAYEETLPAGGTVCTVGANRGTNAFAGFLDELKITRGQALYTGGDFPLASPPSVRILSMILPTASTNDVLDLLVEASSDLGIRRVELLTNNAVLFTTGEPTLAGSWRPSVPGTYAFQARAEDAQGNAASSALFLLSVVAPAGGGPTLQILSPAAGAYLNTDTLRVNAWAQDDSGVVRLDFLTNGVALLSTNGDTLAEVWPTPAPGSYSLRVRAVNGAGQALDSSPVAIEVGSTAEGKPVVALTRPSDGAQLTNLTALTLTPSVRTLLPATEIARVEYFDGPVKLGETNAVGDYVWASPSPGVHALWARVADDLGATSQSPTNTVTLYTYARGDLEPPTVVLTSPAFGRSYPSGETIPLTILADAGDGTLRGAEYYVNESLVATNDASLSGASWTPPAPGSYILRARAFTLTGCAGDSPSIAIEVFANQPPAVTWLAPTNGASLGYGYSVALSAQAVDPNRDDAVAKVEFSADGALVASASTPPYTVLWPRPTVGTHTLVATAFDSYGLSASSATTVVTVVDPRVLLHLAFEGDCLDSGPLRLATSVEGPAGYGIGVRDGAVQLAGDSKVVVVNGAALALGSDDFTVELWLRAEKWPTQGRMCLWSQANPDAGGLWLDFENGAAALRWAQTTGAPVALPPQEWHHVAAARQAGTLSLYADGRRLGTLDYPQAIPTSSAPAQLGSFAGGDRFSGSVDEFVITRGQALYVGESYAFHAPPQAFLLSSASGEVSTLDTIRLTVGAAVAEGVARLEIRTNGATLWSAQAASALFDWAQPAAGTYAVQVKATDDQGFTSGSSVLLLTVTNPPAGAPLVVWSDPTDGRAYTNVSALTLTVSATPQAPATRIERIEFFDGATPLGVTGGEGVYWWDSIRPGNHSLWARAFDDLGTAGRSRVSSVSVYGFSSSELRAPRVGLTAPGAGSLFPSSKAISLSAYATAGDSQVTKLEFYANNSLVATVPGAGPYQTPWMPPAAGTYTFLARAYTAANVPGDSAPVTISVFHNRAPVVLLGSPSTGGSFATEQPLVLLAGASDEDTNDLVARVEFYVDGTLIGSTPDAPYQASWPNPSPGGHDVRAVAYDTFGLAGSSAVVSIAIRPPSAQPLPAGTNFFDSLRVKGEDPTNVVVTGSMSPFVVWDQPLGLNCAGYYLDIGTPDGLTNRVELTGLVQEVQLTNLMPAQVYTVTVSAYTPNRVESRPSNPLRYQPRFIGPTALRIAGQPVSTGPVLGPLDTVLAWDPSPDPAVAGYYLNALKQGVPLEVKRVALTNSVQVSRLDPGQNYVFYITAFTAAGAVSEPSNELLYRAAGASGASAPRAGAVDAPPPLELNSTGALRFSTPSRGEYRLEASSDLVHWETLEVFPGVPSRVLEYIDADRARHPARFYRLSGPASVSVPR